MAAACTGLYVGNANICLVSWSEGILEESSMLHGDW